jgi:DNA-binding response OmpR family regulator
MNSSALQRPHILIVSDDEGLSSFLAEGLIYAGFWTSVIASAMQTLEVFRLRTFDVTIVDAALGGLGALELLRRLRGRSSRATGVERTDIPILLIGASPSEITADLTDLVGQDSIVVAPIEIEHLAERIWREVTAWRGLHPDRPWADEAALGSR